MKKVLFIVLFFLLISGLGLGIYYFYHNKIVISDNQVVQNKCLGENEVADYKNDKSDFVGKIIIEIKSKKSSEIISSFEIDDVMLRNYAAEIHKCGIYALRSFNDDYKQSKALPGFSKELWVYNYKGEGNKIINLAGEDKSGKPQVYYSYDFRIDLSEKNLILIKNYLGKDDYALVIKDINTKNDVLTVKPSDVVKKYPNAVGSIGLIKWTDDGRYFWADIFDGAYTNGFIRVDSKNWSYQVFEMPTDMDIGITGPVNFNTGYATLHPGVVWTGVVEMDQQISEQWLKEGKQSKMYLYNLFTKQKELIATTTKPLWEFNPNWLSDTELQYELPTGEKKIYIVK
ncbi:MAG: hypothetical protein Q8N28_02595 [bacterium]|nr:hypothetical protein [bacterium]